MLGLGSNPHIRHEARGEERSGGEPERRDTRKRPSEIGAPQLIGYISHEMRAGRKAPQHIFSLRQKGRRKGRSMFCAVLQLRMAEQQTLSSP